MATSYFDGDSSKTHYIKERPLNATWATGVVSATQNGATGEFSVTTDDTKEYVVFEQQGGSPASSDVKIGGIGKATDSVAIAATLAEVGKIPRRSTAVAAGAEYTRTNNSVTPAKAIEETFS